MQYLNIPPAYAGLKFALADIEVINGLAAIKNEKDLEGLKDSVARKYIDTDAGYDLVAKAESLAEILNSINNILRDNIYNISELNDFGDVVKYKSVPHGADAELEVNLPGILFEYLNKIN